MEEPAVIAPPFVATPLRLHPFRGLRLARRRIGAPSARSAFARPYRAVAQRLLDWQALGQVQHDADPALYLHEYTVNQVTVRGLVGALDLTQVAQGPGAVPAIVPHEGVHGPQVEELAERMAEMAVNPAPILLVHRGPASVRAQIAQVATGPPHWRFTDRARQRHRMWRIEDPAALATIAEGLADTQALIADGHHRYAAYLRLRDAHPGTPWERGLAMLVDQDDTPLFLGAIHRFAVDASIAAVDRAVERSGVLTTSATVAAEATAALAPDAVVVTDGREWRIIRGVDVPGRTAVEVVHDEILDRLPHAELRYHHAAQDALDAAARLPGVALLLPSADLDALTATALGRLLPEKATSFQPKPSLGVLMRALPDESDAP